MFDLEIKTLYNWLNSFIVDVLLTEFFWNPLFILKGILYDSLDVTTFERVCFISSNDDDDFEIEIVAEGAQ